MMYLWKEPESWAERVRKDLEGAIDYWYDDGNTVTYKGVTYGGRLTGNRLDLLDEDLNVVKSFKITIEEL